MQRVSIYFVVAVFSIILGVIVVQAGDISIFNVNILDDSTPTSIVSIQVPDIVYFGNVTEGDVSEEITVKINNTGNTAINVRPRLNNVSDNIMKNLYFREQKTHTVNGTSGIDVPFEKLGDFSFNITVPTTGGVRTDQFYVILNLSGVNVTQDLLNYETEIRFDVIGI
ncbi:MAG: hypothetical protein AABX11_07055 [Nanoarchaeota archaeon]